MTPAAIRSARKRLGLSYAELCLCTLPQGQEPAHYDLAMGARRPEAVRSEFSPHQATVEGDAVTETTLRYIKQKSEIDCGIAALAMACDLKYEQVSDALILGDGNGIRVSEAMGKEGLNDDLVKAFLLFNGWAWQEATRNIWMKGGFHERRPWPPQPFAFTHICFVEATKGWHYCVMDFDGTVRDPWKEDRRSLRHPDYKRISSLLGIYKVSRKYTEAT